MGAPRNKTPKHYLHHGENAEEVDSVWITGWHHQKSCQLWKQASEHNAGKKCMAKDQVAALKMSEIGKFLGGLQR